MHGWFFGAHTNLVCLVVCFPVARHCTEGPSIQAIAMAASKSGMPTPDIQELASLGNHRQNPNHIAHLLQSKFCESTDKDLPMPYFVDTPVQLRTADGLCVTQKEDWPVLATWMVLLVMWPRCGNIWPAQKLGNSGKSIAQKTHSWRTILSKWLSSKTHVWMAVCASEPQIWCKENMWFTWGWRPIPKEWFYQCGVYEEPAVQLECCFKPVTSLGPTKRRYPQELRKWGNWHHGKPVGGATMVFWSCLLQQISRIWPCRQPMATQILEKQSGWPALEQRGFQSLHLGSASRWGVLAKWILFGRCCTWTDLFQLQC